MERGSGFLRDALAGNRPATLIRERFNIAAQRLQPALTVGIRSFTGGNGGRFVAGWSWYQNAQE